MAWTSHGLQNKQGEQVEVGDHIQRFEFSVDFLLRWGILGIRKRFGVMLYESPILKRSPEKLSSC